MKAAVGEVGGFRPPDDPLTSWAGTGPWELPVDEPNGVNRCLRAYPSGDTLAPLAEPQPARAADPKGLKGEPGALAPFPSAGARSPTPVEVQGEVPWWEGGELLGDVEFVLQVDSDEKTGFEVGQGGVLYVGRRRGACTWHCTWQSL